MSIEELKNNDKQNKETTTLEEENNEEVVFDTKGKEKKRKKIIRFVAVTSVMTALSVGLYFLRFPLPIFPPFLKVQFSMLPLLMLSLLEGPIAGIIGLVLKTLIALPFSGSVYVGEFADLLIGSAAVLSASFFYHFHKTKKGGAIALIISTISWIIVGALANYFILIPFYVKVFGFDAVFGMLQIIPNITEENYLIYYILFANIPFNCLLSVVVNLVTYFTYKKVSVIVKKE